MPEPELGLGLHDTALAVGDLQNSPPGLSERLPSQLFDTHRCVDTTIPFRMLPSNSWPWPASMLVQWNGRGR